MGLFTGTAGDDSLTGTASDDTFQLQQGGEDTALGGAGVDNFNMGATLSAHDHIDGGEGNDWVELDGDYSAGLHFAATTMTGVETVRLEAGFDYSLYLNHANVASSGSLTVDGGRLGAGDNLLVDGSNFTSSQTLRVTAGQGDDTLIAGQGLSYFDMGANLTADDHIVGGGATTHLILDGDYSQGLTVTDQTLHDVNFMEFDAGHDYRMTFAPGDYGKIVTFSAYGLTADESLYLDGSGVTGYFAGSGGHGDDTLIGGSGVDRFELSAGGNDFAQGADSKDRFSYFYGGFNAGDTLIGGGGADQLLIIGQQSTPAVTAVFTSTTLQGVESIRIQELDCDLTLDDANVAAGATLSVVSMSSVLRFDGSAETDGQLHLSVQQTGDACTLIGGAGADKLTGGGGTDTLIGGGGGDQISGGDGGDKLVGGFGADVLKGQGGPDRFFYQDAQDSTAAAPDRIVDLTAADQIYLKPVDANDKKAGDQAFHLVDAFTHHRGELMLSYDSAGGKTTLAGDIDGDSHADFVVLIDGDHAGFDNFVL